MRRLTDHCQWIMLVQKDPARFQLAGLTVVSEWHLRVVEGVFGPEAPFVVDQQRLAVDNPRLAVRQHLPLFYAPLRLELSGV